MDKQNLMPQAAQPVNRITTGQLPVQLAELSEEALQLRGDVHLSVLSSRFPDGPEYCNGYCTVDFGYCKVPGQDVFCSYDGDHTE